MNIERKQGKGSHERHRACFGLLIDNYDSFSYNPFQQAAAISRICALSVTRSPSAKSRTESHIILSPGPGYPKDAGICEVVSELGGSIRSLACASAIQAICGCSAAASACRNGSCTASRALARGGYRRAASGSGERPWQRAIIRLWPHRTACRIASRSSRATKSADHGRKTRPCPSTACSLHQNPS